MSERTQADLERFIAVLRVAAATFPEQRIGQILTNAASGDSDLFYTPDNVLTAEIIKFYRRKGVGDGRG